MELVTDRLVLREYTDDDVDGVFAYASDPDVVAHMDWGPASREEVRRFLAYCTVQQAARPRTSYILAITESGGQPFGSVDLTVRGPGRAALGYVLSQVRWGYGFATESARAMLEYGFSALRLRRIEATCRPENTASARVLEKIGMTCEEHLRRHVVIRGEWRDSLLYAAQAPGQY